MPVQVKRSDSTKQALLNAARAEFAEYGLAGARVDRIAEAAGVNKERIYGLFGSKDKLFDVILIDTMHKFIEVVQPLADTEPGDYIGKLYDYHTKHPQLLRLLLWEALHRGADAHDIDGWRSGFYERKSSRAQEQFDVAERQAGLVLLALCGLANWTLAVPQTTRLLLGDAATDTGATRQFMMEFARAALHRTPAVNALTTDRKTTESNEPTSAQSVTNGNSVTDSDALVDQAAERLRKAQAAADAAREDLADALRTAHKDGTSANQLARQVSGTLSRPVVLKLLAE